MNLLNVLRAIKGDIERLSQEKKEKIAKIEQDYNEMHQKLTTAYEVNYQMNTTCLQCEGKTYVLEGFSGYESRSSDLDKVTCKRCRGTGIEPEAKKKESKL